MQKDSHILLNSLDPETLLSRIRDVVREELEQIQIKDNDQLISPADTCKLFQPAISKGTLSNWTKKDLLQEYRIGGRVYYKKSEVIACVPRLQKYKN